MNIYQRINRCRKQVALVVKDKKVEGKGYMAVTHDAVTSAVRDFLIQEGVVVVPTLVSSTVTPSGSTTGKGIPIIRLEATYEVSFVNEEEPSDRLTLTVLAHALDEGDKAPGKALSYATKYALLKVLSLETGEDDEDRTKQRIAERTAREATAVQPTAGALAALSEDLQIVVMDVSAEVMEAFEAGKVKDASEILEEAYAKPWASSAEARVALWKALDSKCRTALRKYKEDVKVTSGFIQA